MSSPASGFARALAALREAGVEFVVVGVAGIDFYARTPGEVFATVDLDALLAPAAANLRAALQVLTARGYVFEAGGDPFLETAIHFEEGQIDLMTSVAGFSYGELESDATSFEVGGTLVRVGRLEKLLLAKERSGRPKDVEFLRAFAARNPEDREG